ncbi:class I SAM-dependent methyltransferase [Aquibaculum arenosum]|uniref:Class I SAM-dependent methyltransferase n=1 Tax=Aquibaculum arenosum TaxID=3032591 RepID=A0ABT5YIL5_9PROT|nr:class I SAM-dependent methyltransferase [Fodinicurvata sp. CAU 1616]MDF2094789.1 class I SAM-dependent methyltransferase [Fodinicurvata sp. CAU 1616]
MSSQINITDEITDYLLSVSLREDPVLRDLREETVAALSSRSGMQISPHQGQFMRLLAGLMGVRRGIEVGTFTGYSALCTAQALPADGRLVCCDLSEEWTGIARRYWERAGVAQKIELRLGPAGDTLDALLKEGGAGAYDWLFLDADKTGYDGYYEQGLRLLRPGGLILVDNVLWNGAVLRPADELDAKQEADTLALQAFNEKLHGDERVEISLLPLGDGLTLARKR